MASNEYPVAVIGIACRVPHCENPSEFWQFIRNKEDAVGKFPSNRAKDIDHIFRSIDSSKIMKSGNPYFTGSWFESIDKFDAQFFGISPKEAEFLDPQQRFFMRTAWEAFEDAGIAAQVSGSEIGVYVGDTCNKYEQLIAERTPSSVFGNHPVFIAPRPSCAFDLRGPAVLVGTGCSSSLMAIHLACQALKNGDCKAAIAGGVTIESLPINLKSDLWNLLKITADDISCTPFNDNPKGTVKGEGCAAVVLKPLSEAIKDGNHIYGVVCGTSTNQNGTGNGLSLPNPKANCEVMLDAWRKAGIEADDIDYFEAHGTGTKIGDPIEILGIQMAFENTNTKRSSKKRKEKPYLGSVKANVGHMADGVAGVIGFIKVLLALENETIPPQIHYENPNKMIDWKRCPFQINTEDVEWRQSEKKARVASVSSFGLVGTNVHLVVREFKPAQQSKIDDHSESGQLILLSAATETSLKGFIKKLRSYLKSVKHSKYAQVFKNVAYTLNAGREHMKFNVKSLIFAENIEELNEKLGNILNHLNAEEIRTLTVNDADIVKDTLKKEGYLCFAVDPKKKLKSSKSKQWEQSKFSDCVELFKAIVNREKICWKKTHAHTIVPLLPTYCFDEERYWPALPPKGLTEGSDSAAASISSTEGYFSDDKHRTEAVEAQLNSKDNYRKTLTTLTKHIQSARNLSEDDLHFFSNLGDLLHVVQKKLKNSLEDNTADVKIPLAGTSPNSRRNGELFLNFEIEEENIRCIEKLLKNVSLVNHSPHTIVQSIVKSKDSKNVDFQMLVLTDEMSDSFCEQLSQVLRQTDEIMEKVPLIILELRLSPNSEFNFSKTLKLKHRRIYSHTYEIQSKYQMSFAKDQYDVPFNFVGYEYVSSLICRTIYTALFPTKMKVIAVDADNTLWRGECSNERIIVEPHNLYLQEFLIKKYEEGFLLVLLSKNTERDIEHVFREQKDDLLITLDHFVVRKVNWNSKHDNLSGVCKELNLSADSVTFIDDNIHECLSMVTQQPSVLSLCFPSTLSATRGLLDNIWALDSFESTNDGKRRNDFYRQESERKETLSDQSLSEVLHSWKMILRVFNSKISSLKSQHYEAFNRCQELIHRTNQFKMNTHVADMIDVSNCKCLVFTLDDKFGSYGTVSVVVYRIENQILTVEQWVISCRALGRNVEHNILRYLQAIAAKFDCESIRIKFNRTEKNDPAFNFLREANFKEISHSNGIKWMSTFTTLNGFVTIQTHQVEAPEINNKSDEDSMQNLHRNSSQFEDLSETDFKENINACRKWIQSWPKELRSQRRIDSLNSALLDNVEEEQQQKGDDIHEKSVLSESWYEVLNVHPTDKTHFFECGGTSFKAVYLISKLREKLQLDIRLSHIYKNPTFGEIRKLLKSLDSLKRLRPPTPDSNEYKLSALQNTFVMLQEVAPESTAYTENIAVSGFFDDFNTKELLQKLLKYFPLLKCVVDENENCDKIMSQLTEEEVIRSSILKSVSVDTKEAAVRKARDSRPFFTLKNDEPLLRLLPIEIRNDSDANKMVVLYVHHILIDDVSLSDLEHCLEQILLKQNIRRRPELKSYHDFSRSEHQYLTSEQMQQDLQTIANSFEKVPSNATLGFSSEIWSDTKTYDCKSNRFEVTANVDEVCRAMNIRPFHYFLSCYLLTLKRYTAENDLLLSLPLTTRSHGFENSFGPFLNMVLFRYEIDPESNVQTYMQSVASKWFKTQDINALPLEKVLSYLRENEKIATSALSSIFNYSAIKKCDSSVYIPPLHARAPLYINIRENGRNDISIAIEWAPAFIDNQIADNFSQTFVNICEKIADNFVKLRTESVSTIDLMCESERKTIMNFNRKLPETPIVFAHRFFEKHCKENPKKVVINCGDKSFTYDQLNSMANKIAAYLQQTVSEVDLQKKPIVIMMERTEMVIASIFAVWKVGGYFLTISEDIQERLLQLEHTRKVTVDLILTNLKPEQIHVKIPKHIKVKNVNEIVREKSTALFEDKMNSRDPKTTIAYMFLTSGTTGEPKRCLITHQALNKFVKGFLNEYNTAPFEMNLLQFVSICFDVFLQDLAISLLCVGGSMTIASQKDRLDVDKVAKIMEDHKISCCSITPQFALSLFSDLPQKSLKQFRMMIVCGEEFYQNMYQKLSTKLDPKARIVNMWGVTETTLVTTFFSGNLNYLTSSAQVPIGRALAGINVFIVDPNTKLLSPIGTVGEICVTGVVVGKGDVKSTHLSFTGDDAVCFTGDKGRWLPDGNIDFIGRSASTFFKLRGFRVNPREIELVVTKTIGKKLEHIRVFSTEDRFNQRILCLVYKPKPDMQSSDIHQEIRTIIKTLLPYYMVPSVIKCINEIPLTSHGKTDERALRKLCLGDEIEEKVQKKPSKTNLTATESMLMKYLKASLAHSQPIDANLNFRDQGIHSLTLMKFANLMLNDKVPGFKGVVDLFDYPNIKALAQNISAYNVTIEPQFVSNPKSDDCKIAVVGVSFRLPKNIKTFAEFVKALQEKQCLVDEFPASRANDYLTRLDSDELEKIKNKPTFKGGFLDEIDKFDNEFFGISPLEAKHMCPEQRLWMEVATEAITDSGHISTIRGSNFGVFMAFTDISYEEINHSNEAVGVVGKLASFIPARTAYHFDLKGPTITTNSACSSGVVVLHQACEAIKAGTCDGAIIGGLHFILYPTKDGWMDEKMCIQSADSCCRPFDENSNGIVPGEGVIALVLEPLQKALDNNRYIYGVIESTCVNSVGRGNGITAPSVSSQRDLLTGAINASSLSSSDIKVIEAHGSGTKLGDTIELTALQDVFKENPEPVYVCGSKSNFGHLNEASGFLGILKVLTALITREIPAAVNFDRPNSVLKNSNLVIPTRTVKFESDFAAGVSAFGLSGTNGHVIFSRRDVLQKNSNVASAMTYPLFLSYYSYDELRQQIEDYYNYIKLMVIDTKITNIPEICATICRTLKNTAKKRNKGENMRLVLLLQNEQQALALLKKLKSPDRSTLKKLSGHDANVIVTEKGTNEFIDAFIASGDINTDFVATFKEVPNAPCLPRFIFQSTRHWPEECSQKPMPKSPITELSLKNAQNICIKSLLDKQLAEIQELISEVDFKTTAAAQETIDRFCSICIAQILRQCNLQKYWKVGKTYDTREIFKKTEIIEIYFMLFRSLMRHLAKCGIIKSNKIIYDDLPVNFTILVDLDDERLNEDPVEIANKAVQEYPCHQDCFKLVLHNRQSFVDVLFGRDSSLSVLFNGGDFDFNARHYMVGDPLGSIYMKKGIATIAKYVKKLASQTDRKIRVLELGGGFGLLTKELVPKFENTENIEYWFTDIGKTFVNSAKRVYSKYSRFMKYGVFDITKPAEEQGIPTEVDVIVAYNVVHATESIQKTCQNMYRTLNKDGVMFLFETTLATIWMSLSWGIFEAWWTVKDFEYRSEALCRAHNWERILETLKFKSVYSWPAKEEERKFVSRFMFVCCKQDVVQIENVERPQLPATKAVVDKQQLEQKQTATKPQREKKPKREVKTSTNKKSYEEVKTSLKKIWQSILGVDDIEEDDRFGELGGESLLTIEMMHNVRKDIGVELQLAHCYAYPSLQELSKFIVSLCNDTEEPESSSSNESSSESSIESSDEAIDCNDDDESPQSPILKKKSEFSYTYKKAATKSGIKSLLDKHLIEVREMIGEIDFKPKGDAQETIDRYGVACIAQFLRDISLEKYWKVGKTYNAEELFKKTKVKDNYFSLFKVLLRHLAKFGIIKSNKTVSEHVPVNFTILVDLNDKRMNEDPKSIASYGIKAFPSYQDCFKIAQHVMKSFKDVLVGKTSPLSVLFNDGDFDFNSRHDKVGDPLGSIYMKKGIAAIADYVKTLAEENDRTIRVLEIGAGFGQLTEQLVPKFANIENVEYWFTDVGKTFLNKAQKVYSKYDKIMKYALFDITKPAEEQGVPADFDVIVAFNVVHVTESLQDTTQNMYDTLNNTGTMFIFETVRPNIWITFGWGIFDGWWLFKDSDLRSEALCTAENWNKVFNRSDFDAVHTWPDNEEEREYVSRFMFVCCKDEDGSEGVKRPKLKLDTSASQPKSEDTKSSSITKKEKHKNSHQKQQKTKRGDKQPAAISGKKSYDEVVNSLRNIWSSILGVEEIEEGDRFGELGGESLLTIEMMHNVRNKIGVELQLAHCYAYPSLQELANFIVTLCNNTEESEDCSSTEEVVSDSSSDSEQSNYSDEVEIPQSPVMKKRIEFSTYSNDANESSDIKSLLERYLIEIQELIAELDFKPKRDAQETIDRYGVACIAQLFREISLQKYWRVGKKYDTEEIFKKTKVKDNYFSLFRVLLRHLAKFDIIKCNKVIYDDLPVNFTILVDLNDKRMNEDPKSIASYGIKTYPGYQDCFKIAQHVMKSFRKVLVGKESPLAVLFNDGDFDFNSRHDKVGDPIGSIYMKKGVEAIADHVKKLAAHNERTIRILEIGAGFGQLTEQLVPKFNGTENIEYWFTDVGKTFLNKAQKVYSKYEKIMRYGIFDITKPAEEQGLPSDFDVIVAYNVVHVTESLQQTCENLYATLNDTGAMFIFETVRPNIWITFGWGIFDGWWLFKDCELRSEALCTEDNWNKVFNKINFKSVYTWPANKEEKEYVSRFMFVCCKEEYRSDIVERSKSKLETNTTSSLKRDAKKSQPITKKHKESEITESVKDKRNQRKNTYSANKKSYKEVVDSLRKIWSTILGVEEIEEGDRFGELGGESLLTIEMMHNVRNQIGVELQLAHCYAYPSLQELANFIVTLFDDSLQTGNSESDEESSSGNSDCDNVDCNDEIERQLLREPEDKEVSLLMFCGQGAQKETMFSSLLDDPKALEVFKEAKEIIGVDLIKQFKHKECLKRTSFIQPALFVGCMAKIRQLENENPCLLSKVKVVAGLSVGEIAALTYAKVLSFADGLRLVYRRGNAMQDVVDATPSAMASVLGPNRENLTSFLEVNFPDLCISGYLADNQHTVSGDESTVNEFLLKLSEESIVNELQLTDVRKLRVPGAFHTHFMQEAASEIESLIDSITFNRPQIPIILNVNGKATRDPKLIKEGIKQQCCRALEWRQTIVTAVEMGIRNFIEISPAPILTAIVRRRIQECVDSKCTATLLQM